MQRVPRVSTLGIFTRRPHHSIRNDDLKDNKEKVAENESISICCDEALMRSVSRSIAIIDKIDKVQERK